MGARPAGTGLDKRSSALLSYFLIWASGILFLFLEKDDQDVRFHAAQSIVLFGGLTAALIVFGLLPYVGWILADLVDLAMFVGWLYCLYQSWVGEGARFEIPGIGQYITPYAERIAASGQR